MDLFCRTAVMALYSLQIHVYLILHCGNRDFLPFCSCDLDIDQMTFIYELDRFFQEIRLMCKL